VNVSANILNAKFEKNIVVGGGGGGGEGEGGKGGRGSARERREDFLL